jgi:hypothetical protein
VIKARMYAAIWDRKCKICLEKRKARLGQLMDDLPEYKYVAMPAWTCVNMDVFNPIIIILYTTRTRAIWLDISNDYCTEAVLHTVRRLMVAKGVRLMHKQDGSREYKPGQPNHLKQDVKLLILLVPIDDEQEEVKDTDVQAETEPEVIKVGAIGYL